MGIDENTYELIDQYLQGNLQEDHAFVQRLKEDEELSQEVELRKLMNVAIMNYRLMDVEKLLDNKRNAFIDPKPNKWKWVLWALPILMIGTVAYFYTSSSKQEAATQSKTLPIQENTLAQDKVAEPVIKKISIPKQKQITKTEEPSINITAPKPIVLETKETAPVALIEHKPTFSEPERKAESIPQKESTIIPANPCLGIRIKAFVEEERPCRGTAEGQLRIKETKGGKAPYQFSLEGKRFQEESKFAGLKADEYNIVVKDANNCETVVYEKYPLKSKNCINYSEHIFNPNVNTWEVPNNQEKQGELTILDENGHMVYSRTFDKLEKINWGGLRSSGELLVSGVYIYNMKYTDGVVEQGKITITY